jgi:hypothetical protein
VLGWKTAADVIDEIAKGYTDETGHESYVFCGSSNGAWIEDVHTVQL